MEVKMYDAIIVGARCAGSPTAMLLARKGYDVLLVDKSSFPSDTISTHIVWPRGAAKLKEWGLLDKVAESNCPKIEKMTFDVGPFALKGTHPPYDGVTECYAPRRSVLDKILADAAVDAGVEMRENCAVVEIVSDGGMATGVRCRADGSAPVAEKARVVIGADGRNSIVARDMEAPKYNEKPVYACWYYAYWGNVPRDGIEFYMAPERAIGFIPTNDGLACVAIATPIAEFDKCRSDVEGTFMRSLGLTPKLLDRLSDGQRETKFFGTADIPNFFRKPYGPGWALAGDAGYHKDPIGAQGISDAFRDAERLATALDDGFSGRRPLDEAFAAYERARNEEVGAMYEFNCELAALEPPPPEMQQLFGALRGNQADTDRFFGLLAGTVPVPEFFSPENMQRINSSVS
jgi:flavin-dependent dehydrogenase